MKKQADLEKTNISVMGTTRNLSLLGKIQSCVRRRKTRAKIYFQKFIPYTKDYNWKTDLLMVLIAK